MDEELKRRDKRVQSAYNYELKFLGPLLILPLIFAIYEIYSCGTSCPKISNNDTTAGLALYIISIMATITGYTIYESITLGSSHQATLGMRKAGIYITRKNLTKHNYYSAIAAVMHARILDLSRLQR